MRTKILLTLLLTMVVIGGCAGTAITPTPAPTKYAIVFGASNATSSEAVQEAMLAIQNAATVGYKPVSIGGGSGSAASATSRIQDASTVQILQESGSQFVVYVLLEGPATAPDILSATGIPVPSP